MNGNEVTSTRLIQNLMYLIGLPPTLPKSNLLKKICILYLTLFNIAVVYMTYFQQNGRVYCGYRTDSIYKDTPTRFLSSLGSISLALMNITISLTFMLFQPRSHEKLVQTLRELNGMLSCNSPNQNKTVRRIIIIHCIFISACSLDFYLWVARKSLTVYKYFVFDTVLRYRLMVFGMYMVNFPREFSNGAKCMNKILKCANTKYDKSVTNIKVI
ncbi:hypothetical protein QE152_g23287 [Popillia japonica]|uniref:Vomeronasal type-1 receptor n=1 Tax=Popillia japonica TaxID=7064 RepID=A0AAW1KHE6_POPJA